MGFQKWRLRRGASQRLPFRIGIPAPRTQRHLWEPVPADRTHPPPPTRVLARAPDARTRQPRPPPGPFGVRTLGSGTCTQEAGLSSGLAHYCR